MRFHFFRDGILSEICAKSRLNVLFFLYLLSLMSETRRHSLSFALKMAPRQILIMYRLRMKPEIFHKYIKCTPVSDTRPQNIFHQFHHMFTCKPSAAEGLQVFKGVSHFLHKDIAHYESGTGSKKSVISSDRYFMVNTVRHDNC